MANNNHFELALDTLAPAGGIWNNSDKQNITVYKNTNFYLTHTFGDATLKVYWVDTTAEQNIINYAIGQAYSIGNCVCYDSDIYIITKAITAAANTSAAVLTGNSTLLVWEAANTTIKTALTVEGDNYYHMIIKDDVNNMSEVYNTGDIYYDKTSPVISSVVLDNGAAYTKNNYARLDCVWSDSGSGVASASYTIKNCDGTQTAAGTLTVSEEGCTVEELSFGTPLKDGTYTVTVSIVDNAGNISAEAYDTIIRDTVVGVPALTLYKKDATTKLPTWISYTDPDYADRTITASIDKGTAELADIVKYKIVENNSTVLVGWTNWPAGAESFETNVTLTTGDSYEGKKLKVIILDKANNEASSNEVTVKVDSVAPTASIKSVNKTIISSVTNYTTSTVNVLAQKATSSSGIKSYSLTCNGGVIDGVGTLDANGNLAITVTKAACSTHMVEGNNTITWTVLDNANNTSSASTTIRYDSTAPVVTINEITGWLNQKPGATVIITEAGSGFDEVEGEYHAAQLNIWMNTSPNDTQIPGTVTAIIPQSGTNNIESTHITGIPSDCTEKNLMYIHAQAIDNVGNKSTVVHTSFKYDGTAPAKPEITWKQAAYSGTTAEADITATDPSSGISKMKIDYSNDNGVTWTTITNPEFETYSASKTITITGTDGDKLIRVTVQDKAGNTSVVSDSAKCEYDTTKPSGSIGLFEVGGLTQKANVSNIRTFAVRLIGYDDLTVGTATQYKLYGNFTTAMDDYAPYEKDAGQVYMTIDNLECTDNSGQTPGAKDYGKKTIIVRYKDNAGNESDPISAVFTYDDQLPVATVTNLDHNNISKVHSYRDTGCTSSHNPSAQHYSDECTFTIDVGNTKVTEWCVCAYADQTQARNGYEAAKAAGTVNAWVELQRDKYTIVNTNGSSNMSGTRAAAASNIKDCLIKGADYEYTLNNKCGITGSADGGHYVVVYIKNEAGTWSVAAEFAA